MDGWRCVICGGCCGGEESCVIMIMYNRLFFEFVTEEVFMKDEGYVVVFSE